MHFSKRPICLSDSRKFLGLNPAHVSDVLNVTFLISEVKIVFLKYGYVKLCSYIENTSGEL